MCITRKVIENLAERRENLLKGKVNCIPFPMPKLRSELPGFERGRYYLVTAATKSSKSQFTNDFFIYETIEYALMNHIKLKVLYFMLEENKESVVERYMSHLLYEMSDGRWRISPVDLRSTDQNRPLPKECLELLFSDYVQTRLSKFEECVQMSYTSNATGIWKEVEKYAMDNGTIYRKPLEITNEFGGKETVQQFDRYVPNDPEEYVFVIIDHLGLLTPERGEELWDSISKVSKLGVKMRNRFNYSPVFIQQQSKFETLDAFKADKLEPSIVNLADNKYTSNECNVLLGIFSPYRYRLPKYRGYDICKLQDHIRFLSVIINRDGQCGAVLPMYYDGAVAHFSEMPRPESPNMGEIYMKIQKTLI